MAEKKVHHVVMNPTGGWVVKKAGATRVSGTYKTQQEALSSAEKISRNQGSRVVVHGRNGRIQSK